MDDHASGVAVIKSEFIVNSDDARPSKIARIEVNNEANKQGQCLTQKDKRKKQRRNAQINSSITKVCSHAIIPFPTPDPGDIKICPYIEKGCRYSHDLQAAVSQKPPDFLGHCPVLKLKGQCPAGFLCRWASGHCLESISPQPASPNESANQMNLNLQSRLRKYQYDFGRANQIVEQINKWTKTVRVQDSDDSKVEEKANMLGSVSDEDLIKLRPCEKTKIDFRDKLFLAPLTTVGNLPFRRICKRFGADVTCGEMALATNILQGKQSEWALLRRHPCEDIFGVQICGAHIDTMTRCAQLIDETCDVDFIDVNCGCPIDMIYRKGAGSGLLRPSSRLQSIVLGLDATLRKASVTVKMRSGIQEGKKTAHLLIPGLKRAGAALITVHGRSREQRYTGRADWDYVKQCVQLADPIPVFGNGDILSYEEYVQRTEESGCAGVMIGRGALIKPWIFTEIKECRTWDISASERFDLLKDFTNYGLEQWGSDYRGVETTRNFLLEWLSFLYRYIPYGLLERVPQRINERPPTYFGRNDLETLFASPNCSDWIRISEMLLGPAPDGFTFEPKHKANAYT